MSREGSCRPTILIPGENTSSMNSQLLRFCVRYTQVWAFESQACFRILGTHFLTKNSQQEIAGRRHTLDLELSYLERTENIQKQNQSHELPGKTNTKSYFLNCTSGRVCSGRIWKWGETKALTRGPSQIWGENTQELSIVALFHVDSQTLLTDKGAP